MSNFTFTPGPWEPRKRYYADFDLPHWEVAYGDMEAYRLVAGYVRTEADACLIATAPEMKDLLWDAWQDLNALSNGDQSCDARYEATETMDKIMRLLHRIDGEGD